MNVHRLIIAHRKSGFSWAESKQELEDKPGKSTILSSSLQHTAQRQPIHRYARPFHPGSPRASSPPSSLIPTRDPRTALGILRLHEPERDDRQPVKHRREHGPQRHHARPLKYAPMLVHLSLSGLQQSKCHTTPCLASKFPGPSPPGCLVCFVVLSLFHMKLIKSPSKTI